MMTIKALCNLDEVTRDNYVSSEIEEVFPTLSVPWYVGRPITVMLSDEAETAYYSPAEEKIVVATKLVKEGVVRALEAATLDLTKWSKVTVERLVRTVLFHEASHAMATPAAGLKTWMGNSENAFLLNILEDQRIELLFKEFYLDCDFEMFRELVIPETVTPMDKGFGPKSAFLSFVRRGDMTWASLHPTADLKAMLIKWLVDNRSVTRSTNQWQLWDFVRNAQKIWERFQEIFQNGQTPQKQPQQNQSLQGPGGQGQNSQDNSQQPQQGQEPPEDKDSPQGGQQGQNNNKGQKKDKQSGGGAGGPQQKDDKSTKSDKSKDSEDQKDAQEGKPTPSDSPFDNIEGYSLKTEDGSFADQMGWEEPHADPTLERELMRIFGASEKRKKATASARDAYSGKLNVRSFSRENDNNGKIFIRSGNGGHKGFAKWHLNLWLDESGSMDYNEEAVNMLLTALFRVEKKIKDFSWTWIGCGDGQRIYSKKNHPEKYTAWDGTHLKPEVFEQMKMVTKRDAINLNVVLYDGSAGGGNNWKVFNRKDSIVITDKSNERAILGAWGVDYRQHKGKLKIIRSNYADVLIKTLIKELELLTNKM